MLTTSWRYCLLILGSVLLILFCTTSSTKTYHATVEPAPPVPQENIYDIHNRTLGVSQRSENTAVCSALTFQFSNIFVVNLPTRTDHRDAMILSAAISNITFELRDGVKGDTVLRKVLPPQTTPKDLTHGDIGCWRGHMNVLAE